METNSVELGIIKRFQVLSLGYTEGELVLQKCDEYFSFR